MNILIAGLPHTGTSLIADWLNYYMDDVSLPTDSMLHDTLGYPTLESASIELINHILAYASYREYNDYGLMNTLRNELVFAFTQAFPNINYLWKTTALQQHSKFYFQFFQDNPQYKPDLVVVVVRNVHNYIGSIHKRHPEKDEFTIKSELEYGYSLLANLQKQYPVHIIKLEEMMEAPIAQMNNILRHLELPETKKPYTFDKKKVTIAKPTELSRQLEESEGYRKLWYN